jgi:hypothetical protein
MTDSSLVPITDYLPGYPDVPAWVRKAISQARCEQSLRDDFDEAFADPRVTHYRSDPCDNEQLVVTVVPTEDLKIPKGIYFWRCKAGSQRFESFMPVLIAIKVEATPLVALLTAAGELLR